MPKTTAVKQNDDPSGDASPQFLKICKPGTFVLHITGSGKGVFDLQAKPLPEVAHPAGPLLLCNYMLDNDKAYDWILKYQKGLKTGSLSARVEGRSEHKTLK